GNFLQVVGKPSGGALLSLQVTNETLELLPMLAQPLILITLLADEALLLSGQRPMLFDQVEALLLQLSDTQLHRLAFGGHIGFGGNHFSGDVLQPPCCILADARETLLGSHYLHFQSRDLLITPPAKRAQRDEQRNDQ